MLYLLTAQVDPSNDRLFNFTRGRFVCDEEFQMSQRHVQFNVVQLVRIAAESVGSTSCISIEKYPDGMFNKALLLTMDDGAQVVVKLPNPNAGQPHLTTASEVATMAFARERLGTPIPRVLAWNSRAHDNPVGAEYIVMEKAPGVELERVWPSMSIGDKWRVIRALANYQADWMSVTFHGFGSLYFTKDINQGALSQSLYTDRNGTVITDSTFAIGPSTGREQVDDGRMSIDFDRGPWSTLESYLVAIGQREMACVKQLPRLPRSPITLYGPSTYLPTRERKLEALQCYLKLIPFLSPPNRDIATSHLWHGDLHVANIFVSPSKPTEIVSIIDWQSTELSPLFYQARQPCLVDYVGPPMIGLERPRVPTDEEMLDDKTEQLYIQQSLCSLYNTLTYRRNPRLRAAFEFQQTDNYLLLLLARNIVIDGEVTYLSHAAEMQSKRHSVPEAEGSAWPISFTEEERHKLKAELDGALLGMKLMSSIRNSIGELYPEKGIVALDQYEEALNALEQMKEQVIQQYAKDEREAAVWQEEWPFNKHV